MGQVSRDKKCPQHRAETHRASELSRGFSLTTKDRAQVNQPAGLGVQCWGAHTQMYKLGNTGFQISGNIKIATCLVS